MTDIKKPVIGITCGDLNGIGIELIIKTFSDSRILDLCVPVVFANNKAISFYRKKMGASSFNFSYVKEFENINPKQGIIYNCWEEDVNITPGILNELGGRYAVLSLQTAIKALRERHIDGLVTAPIHKSNVQSDAFSYTGHTPYLKASFPTNDVAMMMCAADMKIALATEHIPVSDVAKNIFIEGLMSKLTVVHESLRKDFGITKPRIAVLGLNPHAGDEGLIGNEEETIIKPAITKIKYQHILAFGPYSADAFFARGKYKNFDAVLAMYHDQGLIPFKSLAVGEGINFTAGIDIVRTSPDHGVAFDIAGKNLADEASFREAVYNCVDIIKSRAEYNYQRSNTLKKVTPQMISKLEDEKIEE